MISRKKVSKKKIILYAVIIVIMILGNIFIYYKNSNTVSPDLSDGLTNDLNLDTPLEIQTSKTRAVIENNLFITLKKIGDWPVTPKKIGKVDPFAPFFTK